jgi:hypothetical protein
VDDTSAHSKGSSNITQWRSTLHHSNGMGNFLIIQMMWDHLQTSNLYKQNGLPSLPWLELVVGKCFKTDLSQKTEWKIAVKQCQCLNLDLHMQVRILLEWDVFTNGRNLFKRTKIQFSQLH